MSDCHVYYPGPTDTCREILTVSGLTGVRWSFGADVPSESDYSVLIAGRPAPEQLAGSAALKYMVIPFAGVPAGTGERLVDYPDLQLHNLHYNAATTAEQAILLMLAAARRLIPSDQAFRESATWVLPEPGGQSTSMEGKTALILGYGEIGRRVAQVCRALGMDVVGIRRMPRGDEPDPVETPDQLHALLPKTDVLHVCAPNTPDTDGMISAAELELLPSNAIVVNIGRGPIIDQAALYESLKERRLFGAGLDVWYNYPPRRDEPGTKPADHPFEELDNVVMTPHRASHIIESEERRAEHLLRTVAAIVSGEDVPHPVDLARGY